MIVLFQALLRIGLKFKYRVLIIVFKNYLKGEVVLWLYRNANTCNLEKQYIFTERWGVEWLFINQFYFFYLLKKSSE